MAEVGEKIGSEKEIAMRVEDLIFLDDLEALDVPWIARLASSCTSHRDVESVWTLIRMWGPDDEDAKELMELSTQAPPLKQEVEKMLGIIRICDDYRPNALLARQIGDRPKLDKSPDVAQ